MSVYRWGAWWKDIGQPRRLPYDHRSFMIVEWSHVTTRGNTQEIVEQYARGDDERWYLV